MTIQELQDNFADHAEAIYALTAEGGINKPYTGQPRIVDTVRDVMTTLLEGKPREFGGLEAAAAAAIEAVLAGGEGDGANGRGGDGATGGTEGDGAKEAPARAGRSRKKK